MGSVLSTENLRCCKSPEWPRKVFGYIGLEFRSRLWARVPLEYRSRTDSILQMEIESWQ